MISGEDLQKLELAWVDISHGPCFPLRVTDRFDTRRIEDCHGNVVIEQPDIWLPEAAEYLVMAGNILPRLLNEVRAYKAGLESIAEANKQLRTAICRADPTFDFQTCKWTEER